MFICNTFVAICIVFDILCIIICRITGFHPRTQACKVGRGERCTVVKMVVRFPKLLAVVVFVVCNKQPYIYGQGTAACVSFV